MQKLLFIALLSLFGKEPSDGGIAYRNLSWNDFQGSIPARSAFTAAYTSTELILESDSDERGNYTFAVSAYFLPDCSFVRTPTDEVLRHEQTHFKIAYIAALECMAELIPLQGKGWPAQKKAEQLYEKCGIVRDSLNQQFDNETRHSLNTAMEKIWEDKISRQLNTLTHGRNR